MHPWERAWDTPHTHPGDMAVQDLAKCAHMAGHVDGLSTHRGGGIPDERHRKTPSPLDSSLSFLLNRHTHRDTIPHHSILQSFDPSSIQAFHCVVAAMAAMAVSHPRLTAKLALSSHTSSPLPISSSQHICFLLPTATSSSSSVSCDHQTKVCFRILDMFVNVVMGVDEFGSNWVFM